MSPVLPLQGVLGAVATTAVPSPPPPPNGPASDNGGTGAGSAGFALVIGLILVSILLFYALSRSLRRARRNLGGDTLPRGRSSRRHAQRPTIPIRDEAPPKPVPPQGQA